MGGKKIQYLSWTTTLIMFFILEKRLSSFSHNVYMYLFLHSRYVMLRKVRRSERKTRGRPFRCTLLKYSNPNGPLRALFSRRRRHCAMVRRTGFYDLMFWNEYPLKGLWRYRSWNIAGQTWFDSLLPSRMVRNFRHTLNKKMMCWDKHIDYMSYYALVFSLKAKYVHKSIFEQSNDTMFVSERFDVVWNTYKIFWLCSLAVMRIQMNRTEHNQKIYDHKYA